MFLLTIIFCFVSLIIYINRKDCLDKIKKCKNNLENK